jgi:transcriptional regulator with XRE-family HTH domain
MGIAATIDHVDAGHPDDVRARTTVPVDEMISTLVHMRNRDDWPREEFLAWLDGERDRAGFKHDLELAEAAGISHSSISGWRNGRQRPSAATLAKLAEPLGVGAHEVLKKAGALEAVATMMPAASDDAWGVQIIERSTKLSREAKDKLIAIFLEQERRDREEKERRLREQINLVSGT